MKRSSWSGVLPGQKAWGSQIAPNSMNGAVSMLGCAGEVEPVECASLFEHGVDNALEALDIGVDRVDFVALGRSL